jgi:hypothetical protein
MVAVVGNGRDILQRCLEIERFGGSIRFLSVMFFSHPACKTNELSHEDKPCNQMFMTITQWRVSAAKVGLFSTQKRE